MLDAVLNRETLSLTTNMVLEWKSVVQDELLWVSRKFSLELFQFAATKLLVRVVIVCFTTFEVFQTFLFLQRFDTYYFIKYLPVYAGMYFIILSLYSISSILKVMSTALDDLHLIKHSNRETTNRIKMEGLYLNCFMIFTTVAALISGIVHALPVEDDENVFFALAILKEYFPHHWGNWLSWLYRSTFVFISLAMIVPFYAIIHFASYCRFNFYILLNLFQDLSSDHETSDPNRLLGSLHYQKQVKKRLIFCFERLVHIYNIISRVNRELQIFIILFSVVGVILGVSIVTFFVSFQGSFEHRYTRLATLILAGVLVFVHIILAGQMIENLTSRLFEILKVANWYCWNSENKKIYLIFLGFMQCDFKIKFSESISLNYELGVSIARGLYSVASVMVQLKYVDYSNHDSTS
ncbi:hypothetical protein GEV33_003769 [Tenebrio molitor]|uniref:Odorant receptor n=1 Tax=Tenebrio molitor TaxID=7067 RepID=A0A8J6LH69_TENMO|nr:hypothetical protein GEV33_003769 [Tenebrio molitor]